MSHIYIIPIHCSCTLQWSSLSDRTYSYCFPRLSILHLRHSGHTPHHSYTLRVSNILILPLTLSHTCPTLLPYPCYALVLSGGVFSRFQHTHIASDTFHHITAILLLSRPFSALVHAVFLLSPTCPYCLRYSSS